MQHLNFGNGTWEHGFNYCPVHVHVGAEPSTGEFGGGGGQSSVSCDGGDRVSYDGGDRVSCGGGDRVSCESGDRVSVDGGDRMSCAGVDRVSGDSVSCEGGGAERDSASLVDSDEAAGTCSEASTCHFHFSWNVCTVLKSKCTSTCTHVEHVHV